MTMTKKEIIKNIKKVTDRVDFKKLEKNVLRLWKKGIALMIAVSIFGGFINIYLNKSHMMKVDAMNEKYQALENEFSTFYDSKRVQLDILDKEKEKRLKIEAINIYLKRINAHERLFKIVVPLVCLSDIYEIDPFRPMAIILLETKRPSGAFGDSDAIRYNKNVCGLNWTDEQKRRIEIRSDIYNLAVEKTLQASVTNLIILLVEYKGYNNPLVTLSEIQTIYAPSNDSRNGLGGMDNTKWTKNTTYHYYEIEKIFNTLKGEK